VGIRPETRARPFDLLRNLEMEANVGIDLRKADFKWKMA
jgi:hypothetical protein